MQTSNLHLQDNKTNMGNHSVSIPDCCCVSTNAFFVFFYFQLISYSNGVEHINGLERMSMTFRHIVTKTNDVSIGPLEYCGSGIAVRQRSGRRLL